MAKFTWMNVLVSLFGIFTTVQYVSSTTCNTTFQTMGCFSEGQTNMKLIVNDRDSKGHELNWTAMAKSVRSLLCRCRAKTKSIGYQYFSVRFWAECWAGRFLSDLNSILPNKVTAGCQNSTFDLCTDENSECVGEAHFEYMYSLAYWSAWDTWSECSKPCGGGTRSRERTCHAINNAKSDCRGSSLGTEQCKVMDCPKCDWLPDKVGIGSSRIEIPNIQTKEDCFYRCLRVKGVFVDGINFSSTTSTCDCLSGVVATAVVSSLSFCKLRFGGVEIDAGSF